MKLFRKIDTETGLFIEDVLLSDKYNGNEEYISTPVPGGFYWPKWNGTEWVEGGVAPEPTEPEPQALSEAERIEMLENTLLLLMME